MHQTFYRQALLSTKSSLCRIFSSRHIFVYALSLRFLSHRKKESDQSPRIEKARSTIEKEREGITRETRRRNRSSMPREVGARKMA